jgi:hypothetical protein
MNNRPGHDGGSVLICVALLMGAVIGFAGLAVDVSNGYAVRSILQHAVDDGALSALRWSAQLLDSATRDSAGIQQEAVRESLRIAQQELRSHGMAGIARLSAALVGGGLVLTASATVPTYFLVLFGVRSWSPRVRAHTKLWTPARALATGLGRRAIGGAFLLSGPPETGIFVGMPGGGRAATGHIDLGGSVTPNAPQSSEPSNIPGSCNCDGIVAGDAASAQAALERMGVTPADPGPFQGDMTSQVGMGEMQSHPDEGGTQSGDEGSDASP